MKKVISKVFETAPYVRSRITTGDLMYFVVLALLPCAGMGIYRYGFHAALLIGISVGCAFVLAFYGCKAIAVPCIHLLQNVLADYYGINID